MKLGRLIMIGATLITGIVASTGCKKTLPTVGHSPPIRGHDGSLDVEVVDETTTTSAHTSLISTISVPAMVDQKKVVLTNVIINGSLQAAPPPLIINGNWVILLSDGQGDRGVKIVGNAGAPAGSKITITPIVLDDGFGRPSHIGTDVNSYPFMDSSCPTGQRCEQFKSISIQAQGMNRIFGCPPPKPPPAVPPTSCTITIGTN
jgi:hypothetical protein